MQQKHRHFKRHDTCFRTDKSPSTIRRKAKSRQRKKIPNLWRRSRCRLEPEMGTLEYVASIGLLPGLAFSKMEPDGEEEAWPINFKGTSPVASASVAAAMAADIPMCIACTQRQISNDSVTSSRRSSKIDRRSSQQHSRRKSEASATFQRTSSKSNSRASSRSSKSGSKVSLKYSSPRDSIRYQRQILAHLADMSRSAPYIPDSVQSLSSGGEVSSSCAELIPLMRTKSTKSSASKVDTVNCSKSKQQCQRAALLFQVYCSAKYDGIKNLR